MHPVYIINTIDWTSRGKTWNQWTCTMTMDLVESAFVLTEQTRVPLEIKPECTKHIYVAFIFFPCTCWNCIIISLCQSKICSSCSLMPKYGQRSREQNVQYWPAFEIGCDSEFLFFFPYCAEQQQNWIFFFFNKMTWNHLCGVCGVSQMGMFMPGGLCRRMIPYFLTHINTCSQRWCRVSHWRKKRHAARHC